MRLVIALLLLGSLMPSSILAAPPGQQPGPALTVSPSTAAPGQTVRVSASGFTTPEQTGATFCLGILGPGQNLELGASPAFRVRIGQITLGPSGAGDAEVTLPGNLVGGSYRVVIGGCPPQAGLAPLAAIASTTIAVTGPAPSLWFFAEGSTQPPFDTWFLVQNPTGVPAAVRFTFSLENGTDVVRDFTVGANTRFSIFVNQILPNVAFSTRVESAQQIFVERSMFVGFDGSSITGIPAPSQRWLFAEGATVQPFHTWILIQNPLGVPANTTITYLLPDRPPVVQALGPLAPTSRTSVFVNSVLPNQEFSIRVDSDQPIIVEHSMFRFPGNAATATAGANEPRRTWFFAEGSSVPSPLPTDTFLLLENPGTATTTVTITLFGVVGQRNTLQIAMPGNSRRTIFLNDVFPNASFGIRVDSTEPIVAERSQFFGPEPRGATDSLGAPALANEWDLPEGSTQPPFRTAIAVLNPNDQAMSVRMDFQLENGQVVTREFTAGANSKLAVAVNDILPNNAFSTRVTTSLPSVVERTMSFVKDGGTGFTNAVGIPR